MSSREDADSLLARLALGERRDYIGEPVSQLAHALQAADRARRAGAAQELVLAALFHDFGHIVASGPEMDGFGAVDHESIGADHLAAHGCSTQVTEPIREHVRAKRYLCWRHSGYFD